MLKLNPNPVFDADVQITVPGKPKPESVKLTFKVLPKNEFRALLKSLTKEITADDGTVRVEVTDDELVAKVVAGWAGIESEFSAENLQTFLDSYPAAAWDIINSYSRLVHESRVKN